MMIDYVVLHCVALFNQLLELCDFLFHSVDFDAENNYDDDECSFGDTDCFHL